MNSLLDKLRAMQPAVVQTENPARLQTRPTPVDLELQLQSTAHGGYWLREKTFFLQDWPGLEIVPELNGEDFMRIGKHVSLAAMDPLATVFIDAETTGLAGGAGTYAFLIGVAFVQQGKIVIRQYFMQDFSQESALLHALAEHLAGSTGMVTFNGKAYDIPLLRNRVVMNRLKMDWNRFLHLDLLHASRRLWRPFTIDCRLGSMEQAILGFHRQGDIPGELIPALYFTSLRTGDLSGLKPVFQHNVLDLLSLARLVGKAAAIFRGAAQIPFRRLAVAKTYAALGLFEQAGEVCAKTDEPDREENLRLAIFHAANLKRLHRYEEAEKIWLELVHEKYGFSPRPYIELIKYYERQRRDLPAALTLITRARERLELQMQLQQDAEYVFLLNALRGREKRIREKIEKLGNKKEVRS